MQRLLAIIGLTWKAAFRFRLFLVVSVLLLAAVVGLPLLIKDDGTARGFTQILLTYTLSVITALLGFSTLWLACGTLARDIEECQMQMVAVKPVPRWQIWLGKWLGILSLNAALLALSGGSVYGLLLWRASRLPEAEQQVLRKEVLIARGSVKIQGYEREVDAETDRELEERLKQNPVSGADLQEVRALIHEQVKAQSELVPPGLVRQWEIKLGFAQQLVRDQPLQLRFKFNAAKATPSGTFSGLWRAGKPGTTPYQRFGPLSLAPDTYHEIDLPPNLFDKDGVLTLAYANASDTALLFPLEDGIEILYREGGFGLNFARGLGIVFCWMALLAALGLASASLLSFPVAAFFSLAVLAIAFSSGTMATVVSNRTITGSDPETGMLGHSVLDAVMVPAFQASLKVINLARGFSPIDSLSTGRSITWTELGLAFLQIVVLMGGVVSLVGIVLFSRRELATAQGTS
jgi:ABC-type transport system involved in multi-copper enzyme maturation permease subunit